MFNNADCVTEYNIIWIKNCRRIILLFEWRKNLQLVYLLNKLQLDRYKIYSLPKKFMQNKMSIKIYNKN